MSADVLKYGWTFKVYIPIKVRVDPDPLGDVNCIIRVLRRSDDKVIRSILHTNTPGLDPQVGYGSHEYARIPSPFGGHGWPLSYPVFTVEVDGKRIAEIDEYDPDLYERPPLPQPPLHQRLQRRIASRGRNTADVVAKKLGYTRTGECDCDDY